MTTPGDPVLIPVGNSAQPLIPAFPTSNGSPIQALILNTDNLFNLYVGRSAGIGVTNSLLIAPGGSVIWDVSQATYAFTNSDVPPLFAQVSIGTAQYNLGPQQIINILDITAFAAAIAAAIAASGISLLASPQLLYSVSPQTTAGTLVGATIGKQNYSGQTQSQADATFYSYVKRPLPTGVQKWYLTPGQTFTTVPPDLQTIITSGAAILLSVKPSQTVSGIYTDSTITVSGDTCLQEKNNMINMLNLLLTSGLTTATLKVTVWQEPNAGGFATAALYQAYATYYTPGVRSLGLKAVYNPAAGNNQWNGFTGYPGDALVDEIACDFYGNNYITEGYSLDGTGKNDQGSFQSLADNHLPSPVPFSIAEWNNCTKQSLAISHANWAVYEDYLVKLFSARLTAGKPVGWLIFWMGNNAALQNQPDNQILSGNDYKIVDLQSFTDSLSSVTTSKTVAAGATATVTPIIPSSSAGYGICNAMGYEAAFTFNAGVGSTVPFAQVSLKWYATDSTSVRPVASEQWIVPLGVSGSAGTIIRGRGPQKGAFLKLQIINLDTVALTYTVQLNSNGRTIARDDWIWDAPSSVNVPTYTLVSGGVDANSLGSLNTVSVPASGTVQFLFSMWAGQVWFRVNDLGNSGKLTFVLNPQPGVFWGSSAIFNQNPTGEFGEIITMPRGPCVLKVSNSDAGAAHTFSSEMISQE